MSERGGEYSGGLSEFSRRTHEVYGRMRQAMFDVIREFGGESAVEFAEQMNMGIDIANGILPTRELLLDIDKLFPGTGQVLFERWRELVGEAYAIVEDEKRRLQALEDEGILRHYEATGGFDVDGGIEDYGR